MEIPEGVVYNEYCKFDSVRLSVMTKEYLSDDWKASMQLSFDFNHMMADFAADARAAVRSDLRKAAHNLEGKDLETYPKSALEITKSAHPDAAGK